MSKPFPVILIDGRAGSGKTTLAAELHQVLQPRVEQVDIIHMDDLTQGWHGLASASDAVAAMLESRSQRQAATWQRYDWLSGQLAETVTVSPTSWLIIEGCGSISRVSAPLASLRVWLNCNDDVRRWRALRRDGAVFAEFWDVWSAQEQALIRREQPEHLADVVCEGDARDTLGECSRLLSSFLDQEATSEHFWKRVNGANSTLG